MAFDPFATHPLHDRAMKRGWRLIRLLLEGTQAMREAGEEIWPRYAEETEAEYAARMLRLWLYGMFENAVERIVSKPFSRPVAVEGLDELGERFIDDVDRRGTALQPFLHEHFQRKAAFGVAAILSWMPSTKGVADAEGNVPVAEVSRRRLRPYMSHIHPTQVIAWEWKEDETGLEVLGELRVLECVWKQDRDGRFGSIDRVRRYLDDGRWELWEKTSGGPNRLDQGRLPIRYIPATVDVANRKEKDPFASTSPLDALAWLNYRHATSSMEQNLALFGARAMTLYERGATFQEARPGSGGKQEFAPLVLGPFRTYRTTASPQEADLGFVEPTGRGCELGFEDLKAIEALARALGDQPLTERSTTETAKGRALNEGRTESAAHSWVADTERAASRALRICAHLQANGKGQLDELLPNLTLDIYSDFAALGAQGLDSYALVQADHKDGVVSKRMRLASAKRFGVYPETMDVDAELELAEKESDAEFKRQVEVMRLTKGPAADDDFGAGVGVDDDEERERDGDAPASEK